jgi:hypothetical protein
VRGQFRTNTPTATDLLAALGEVGRPPHEFVRTHSSVNLWYVGGRTIFMASRCSTRSASFFSPGEGDPSNTLSCVCLLIREEAISWPPNRSSVLISSLSPCCSTSHSLGASTSERPDTLLDLFRPPFSSGISALKHVWRLCSRTTGRTYAPSLILSKQNSLFSTLDDLLKRLRLLLARHCAA